MRNTTKRVLAAAALLGALFSAAASVSAQQPKQSEVDLQAAIRTQMVDGDLESAIRQFGAIVSKYPGEPAVVAQALVRMAGSYELQGAAEAKKIYERVVREFGDQPEAAALARMRLAAARPNQETTLRKVMDADVQGEISPDGRYLSFSDWDNDDIAHWGDLVVRDLTTGVDNRLGKPNDGNAIYESLFSPDGSRVAYYTCSQGGACKILVSEVREGGQKHRLVAEDPNLGMAPHGWSPDGKVLVASIRNLKAHTAELGLVNVETGSIRSLRPWGWIFTGPVFFSPDGKYLLVDAPPSEQGAQRDVYVISVTDGSQTAVAAHPGKDTAMGWSPDGKFILFVSDRSGSMSLWAQAFERGAAKGQPQIVKPDIGDAVAMGITASGSLYFGLHSGFREIEIASIDLATGKQLGEPSRPVENFVGTNMNPAWSADGKYLAWESGRPGSGGFDVIGIRNMDTGEIREITPNPPLRGLQGLSWKPDGSAIFTLGGLANGDKGIFSVDVKTGTAKPVLVPMPEPLSLEGFFWSPDGKRMYFHSQRGTISEMEETTGKIREVARGNFGPISLSPDGRWIATYEGGWKEDSSTLLLIPVSGGDRRELLRVDKPVWFNNTAMPWTSDGRAILVRKMLEAGGRSSELLYVPVDGSSVRKLDFDANRVDSFAPGKIRLHPDGKRLAYVHGQYHSEVWVLENFLPQLNAGK